MSSRRNYDPDSGKSHCRVREHFRHVGDRARRFRSSRSEEQKCSAAHTARQSRCIQRTALELRHSRYELEDSAPRRRPRWKVDEERHPFRSGGHLAQARMRVVSCPDQAAPSRTTRRL